MKRVCCWLPSVFSPTHSLLSAKLHSKDAVVCRKLFSQFYTTCIVRSAAVVTYRPPRRQICTSRVDLCRSYMNISRKTALLEVSAELFVKRELKTSKVLASRSDEKEDDEAKAKSLVEKFKQLWKRYWYIVLPVHLLTSAVWFGGFYYISYSGVDVISWLEMVHFMPESWLDKLKTAPQAGHVAVAYALYKLASPARYAVTIGGTHVTMRVLSEMGLIKTAKEVREDFSDYIKEKRTAYRIRRESKRKRLKNGPKRNGKNHLHPSHGHHRYKKFEKSKLP